MCKTCGQIYEGDFFDVNSLRIECCNQEPVKVTVWVATLPDGTKEKYIMTKAA